jgi:molybdenum cofactor guanylyltransferase
MVQEMNAIILAGGKNTRMRGEDKAFLEIEGRPIIAILIDRLKALVKEIIIVTNSPQKYANFKVRLTMDEKPDKGPLMGIYSGLKSSSSKYNFIVACDMPFIKIPLIEHMIKSINNYDIIVPEIDGKFHPLFGIYSRECIPVIQEMLNQDVLRISGMFPKLKSHFLSRRELERFDKKLISLVNINTSIDLRMVKRDGGMPICQNQHSEI